MRYLGVDFGSKRVGVALSDELNIFAFPLCVLPNTPNLVGEISTICQKYDVEVIVVGESMNFAQEENDIMKEIRPFVVDLQTELGLPVYLHPEFMTSQEAEQLQGKNEMIDASAAALILKSYLDTFASNS